MIEFFREGGWGMWPVLIFSMVTLGAAVRFAWKPQTTQLKFIAAMGLTTIVSTCHTMLTNVAAVFHYLEDAGRAPDADFSRILVTGLKESTRPGFMSGAFLTFACLLVAIGFLRAPKKTEATKA